MPKKTTKRAKPTPLFSGEVSTPETPTKPTGYLWDQLEGAHTRQEIEQVRDHAKAHGYSSDGQFMTAVADRLSELRR